MSTNFALAISAVFLIVTVAVIIFMFVSLAKQGDERRKKIVETASTSTLFATVFYLLFSIIENIYKVVSRKDLSPEGMNPFIVLTVVSVIYVISLIYYKKKYGD